MLLPKFDYHEPTTLNEACEIMAEFRERGNLCRCTGYQKIVEAILSLSRRSP